MEEQSLERWDGMKSNLGHWSDVNIEQIEPNDKYFGNLKIEPTRGNGVASLKIWEAQTIFFCRWAVYKAKIFLYGIYTNPYTQTLIHQPLYTNPYMKNCSTGFALISRRIWKSVGIRSHRSPSWWRHWHLPAIYTPDDMWCVYDDDDFWNDIFLNQTLSLRHYLHLDSQYLVPELSTGG